MELIGHKIIGSGKNNVLVMHNWIQDSTFCYGPLLPYLDTDNFKYLFADLRGYGHSKDMPGSFNVQEASKDAINLADNLSWDKFHIIGHSMSGMIAQKIAVDNRLRIKSVVAITPVPACGSPGPKELMNFLENAARKDDEKAMECIHLLTGHRYSNLFAKKMVHEWRHCSTKEARINYLNMFSYTDFSESAKGLDTPMLILYGEYDAEGSETMMRETFLKWYPKAHMECCRGAGHFPMLETPVFLASSIEKFLMKSSF